MTHRLFGAILAALVVAPALAQEKEPPARELPLRPARVRPDVRPSDVMFDRFAQMLVRRLDLDDEQQVMLDEIVADFRQRLAEQDSDVEQRQSLWEELRQARESGDHERVAELRDQLRERARQTGDSLVQLLNEVEPILREDQVEPLEQLRSRMQQRAHMNDPRAQVERVVRDLPELLDLTDAQAEEFDLLVEEMRERAAEMRREARDTRSLWREMREARQAGDQQRLEELRAEMAERRPDPQVILHDFYTQLEAMLTDAQRERLVQYRRSQARSGGSPLGGPERERPLDVRQVLRAAHRLDLTEGQAEQVRQIEQEAGRALGEIEPRDREARAALTEDTKKRISELLDEEQRAQFEDLLQGRRERARQRRQREPAEPETPEKDEP